MARRKKKTKNNNRKLKAVQRHRERARIRRQRIRNKAKGGRRVASIIEDSKDRRSQILMDTEQIKRQKRDKAA